MIDYFKMGSDLVRGNAALIRGEPLPIEAKRVSPIDRHENQLIEDDAARARLRKDIESLDDWLKGE